MVYVPRASERARGELVMRAFDIDMQAIRVQFGGRVGIISGAAGIGDGESVVFFARVNYLIGARCSVMSVIDNR